MIDGFFSERAENYEKENAWILSPSFIRPLVPAVFGDGRMLDVCAGTGVISEYAQSIGWDASALDSNKKMLEKVSPRVSVFVGDAHHMPFPDNTFDLVCCRQGIQYLDFQSAIKEMLRVSKSQVRMLHGFIVPQDIALWQKLFEIARGPKRRFFSCDMLNIAIDQSSHRGIEVEFLKSRERFNKPSNSCAEIDGCLKKHPDFVARYHIENYADSFFYDLNWAVHVIKK